LTQFQFLLSSIRDDQWITRDPIKRSLIPIRISPEPSPLRAPAGLFPSRAARVLCSGSPVPPADRLGRSFRPPLSHRSTRHPSPPRNWPPPNLSLSFRSAPSHSL